MGPADHNDGRPGQQERGVALTSPLAHEGITGQPHRLARRRHADSRFSREPVIRARPDRVVCDRRPPLAAGFGATGA